MKKITPRFYRLRVDAQHTLEDVCIDSATEILTQELKNNPGGLVDLMHALIFTMLLANGKAASGERNGNILATIAVTEQIFQAGGYKIDLSAIRTPRHQQDSL